MANLVTYPEAFDNAAWNLTSGSLLVDNTAAPDGTITAEKLTTTSGGGVLTRFLSGTDGLSYVCSVFAKAGTNNYVALEGCFGGSIIADLSNGTITDHEDTVDGTVLEYGCIPYSNGWYRVWVRSLCGSTRNNWEPYIRISNGGTFPIGNTVGDSAFFWGALFEQASILNPYIAESGWRSDSGSVMPPTSVPPGDGVPFNMVVLTMDYCSRTFGVAPCTASGVQCFNTFPTCKDTANFGKTTKDYRFYSAEVRHHVTTARPYVLDLKMLPTEIKTNLTVSGQVNVTMNDEPDGDVGIDPYVASRSNFPAILGTFWKKFVARNRNFKGRPFKVYECWTGVAEGSWALRWYGAIENVKIGRGKVVIEAVDLLKDLSKVEVPPRLDLKLMGNITDSQTSVTLNDATELPSSGYILLDDEIMSYASVTSSTGVLSGVVRGVFGTAPATHDDNVKVQLCRYYPPGNPFDHIITMLEDDGELAAGNIDTAGIEYWRDYPGGETNMAALITEPIKLDKLLIELVDMLDCKIWQNEDQKITVARNLSTDPARTVTPIGDAYNIVEDSGSADLNEKARISRCLFYWDKDPLKKLDDPASYGRLDIAIDADAEGPNEYNTTAAKKTIWCRWLSLYDQVEEDAATFAKILAIRTVGRYRNAPPLITVTVDAKDYPLRTGDWVSLDTDELLDIYGNPLVGMQYQVVKRERKLTNIVLTLVSGSGGIGETIRVAYIHDGNGAADFDSASEAEKLYAYISESSGVMSDGSGPYVIF